MSPPFTADMSASGVIFGCLFDDDEGSHEPKLAGADDVVENERLGGTAETVEVFGGIRAPTRAACAKLGRQAAAPAAATAACRAAFW